MSTDCTHYLGVYLVVDQYIEETMTERACSNRSFKHRKGMGHREDAFCRECGHEMVVDTITSTSRMSCYDAAEEFGFDEEDEFVDVYRGDQPRIWFSNYLGDSFDDCSEVGGHEITPEGIAEAVDEFKAKHAKALKLLDDNDVNYVMLYGLVTTYH